MASKIKVDTIENVAGSGNVSLGSGHNLVVPGNQTVGGTLGVTGASTLTGDTQVTGNLGVGAAPERKFHVEGSGAEFSLVDTSRPTDKKTMNMFIDANGKGNIRMLNDAQSAGNAAITIEGSSPHTSPIVRIPYQPAFKQGVDNRNATGSDRVISGNNGDTFTYQTRDNHNVGGHWSSTTGRFTCPVAGTYMFYCSLMRHGTNGTVLENRIKKNGGLMFARAYADGYTASYQQSMLVTTTVCAVNDYIEFFVQGTTSIYQDDTYLGGYLLG